MEHIIPLRRGFVKTPRHKRAKKAITVLKIYLARHIKADEIKIGQFLNEHVWARGMRNPPGKVAVTSEIKEIDGKKIAHVELSGKKFKESVRPEERKEQEGGLKGKLQELTQAKEKAADKAEEKTEGKEEKAAPKKTPVKAAKKASAKTAEKTAEKASTPKKTTKTE